MTTEIPRNFPTKSGIYFGRTKSGCSWFNHIIEVQGEAPMLYIARAWDRTEDRIVNLKPHDVYFGPEILIPEVPKDEIQK